MDRPSGTVPWNRKTVAWAPLSPMPAGFDIKRQDVLTSQRRLRRNDGKRRTPDHAGIFFSVWVGAGDARRNQANYNIHALKLRHLAGHRITSRAFAADFGAAFARVRRGWPNVGLDYGPQTLMQGWVDIRAPHFAGDVLALMHRFEALSPVIDRL